MPSSSNAPRALLPTGRAKWLWLAVAGVLGVWLVILLATPGGGRTDTAAGPDRAGSSLRERIQAAEGLQKPFDGKAPAAFTQRQDARARRSSPTVRLRVDHGQGK